MPHIAVCDDERAFTYQVTKDGEKEPVKMELGGTRYEADIRQLCKRASQNPTTDQ